MPGLDPSAVSVAALQFRSFLADHIVGLGQIVIDHPKNALSSIDPSKQNLNLFIHRLEFGGHGAGGSSSDPIYVSVHCLITAMGTDERSSRNTVVTAGENDLRLIGRIIDLLHKHPVIHVEANGSVAASMQIVMHSLSLDDLNRLWSTQGDVAYRLSLPVELALLPVPLEMAVERSPKVSDLSVELEPWADREEWIPKIGLLVNDGLQPALTLAQDQIPGTITVVVAGKAGERAIIRTELWDSATGWMEATTAARTVDLVSDGIDPEHLDLSTTETMPFPLAGPGQAEIYAVRATTDAQVKLLRSSPLLISVYGEDA